MCYILMDSGDSDGPAASVQFFSPTPQPVSTHHRGRMSNNGGDEFWMAVNRPGAWRKREYSDHWDAAGLPHPR